MRLYTTKDIRSYLNSIDNGKDIPIFISQPMSGLPEYVIINKRTIVISLMQYEINPKCIAIDTYTKNLNGLDLNESRIPIWCLGDSIKMMANAGLVVFTHEWMYARGCLIEHQICVNYNIPYCHEEDLFREMEED